MRKRCGMTRHRSNGHCEVRSLNHRVKCNHDQVGTDFVFSNQVQSDKFISKFNPTPINWKFQVQILFKSKIISVMLC